MKPDVLVIRTNGPDGIPLLEADYTLHRYDEAVDKAALLDEVGDRIVAVATTGAAGLSREMLAMLPNCRIVASSGVGYDAIDVEACSERGVRVTNTPDVLTDDVADLTIGLLIATQRGMIEGDAYVRTGDWGQNGPMRLTRAVGGRKVGIVGLGRIGQAIAARAEPMGVEIAYFARRERSDTAYRFEPSLVRLAEWAEVLIVAVAGGAETTTLINEAVIRALGQNGTLINISRGSVVDEAAMLAALADGGLGGAGLDVYHNEPRIDPAFAKLRNVTLYPHHASGTRETRYAMARLVAENLRAHFAGEPLPTPVN
jgi:lactate dehydrogenase-like 2-hydroxyacid dehydrogenase